MPGLESGWHWFILGIVVIALFGYKKLPDAARSLGRSLRIFKTEIKGMGEDDAARNAAKEISPPPAAPVTPPAETVNLDKSTVPANGEKPADRPE